MTHIYGCQLCSSFSSSFVLFRCSLDLGLFGPSLMIIGHALRSSEFSYCDWSITVCKIAT